MKTLIILRGLPGSGKSTTAKMLSEGKYPVFSIDDFFTDKEGKYEFHFEQNHLAYKSCQERTEKAMQNGASKIFLDNVFSMEWEMEPYFQLAGKYDYKVTVLTVENRHNGNNIHNIPEEQIKKMAEKFRVKLT